MISVILWFIRNIYLVIQTKIFGLCPGFLAHSSSNTWISLIRAIKVSFILLIRWLLEECPKAGVCQENQSWLMIIELELSVLALSPVSLHKNPRRTGFGALPGWCGGLGRVACLERAWELLTLSPYFALCLSSIWPVPFITNWWSRK